MFVKFWDESLYLINLEHIAEVRLNPYKNEIVFNTMEQFKSEFKSDMSGMPDGDVYFNWHFDLGSSWRDGEKMLVIDEKVLENLFDQLCAAIARKDALFDLEKAIIGYVKQYGVPIDE